MPDTGTGTDPTTDRCPDCGHPLDADCPCYCCPRLPDWRYLGGLHWDGQ